MPYEKSRSKSGNHGAQACLVGVPSTPYMPWAKLSLSLSYCPARAPGGRQICHPPGVASPSAQPPLLAQRSSWQPPYGASSP